MFMGGWTNRGFINPPVSFFSHYLCCNKRL